MIIPRIIIKNASLAYNQELVFSHLNLEIPAGQWVALLGQSGIGKSSLLRLLSGSTSNQEIFQGDFYADNQLSLQEQIAHMAQTDLLIPWLTVLANATLGSQLRFTRRQEKKAAKAKAQDLLEKVGLGHALALYPHQLSGGMRQRVALVRTLMEDKPIVLMDEPFSAVDTVTRYHLQALAKELLSDRTVLFITHDPHEALRLADHIYIMHGKPAHLTWAASLTTPAPRELSHPECQTLQADLFAQLLKTARMDA